MRHGCCGCGWAVLGWCRAGGCQQGGASHLHGECTRQHGRARNTGPPLWGCSCGRRCWSRRSHCVAKPFASLCTSWDRGLQAVCSALRCDRAIDRRIKLTQAPQQADLARREERTLAQRRQELLCAPALVAVPRSSQRSAEPAPLDARYPPRRCELIEGCTTTFTWLSAWLPARACAVRRARARAFATLQRWLACTSPQCASMDQHVAMRAHTLP